MKDYMTWTPVTYTLKVSLRQYKQRGQSLGSQASLVMCNDFYHCCIKDVLSYFKGLSREFVGRTHNIFHEGAGKAKQSCQAFYFNHDLVAIN